MADSKVEGNRKKTGGRVAGTPNKKTKALIDKLEELGCDPIEGMAKIAMNDVECGICGGSGKVEDKPCEPCFGSGKIQSSIELRGNMYKELAQYVAPKRKAIEHTGADGEALIPSSITVVYE